MSEAPERIAIVSVEPMCDMTGPTFDASVATGENACGHKYVRLDRHEEAVRQRDALRSAAITVLKTSVVTGVTGALADAITALGDTVGYCDAPLASADVKTGKVITSAELIKRTDTPEIRGAVAPEGGGRHT